MLTREEELIQSGGEFTCVQWFSELISGYEIASAKRRVKHDGNQHQITAQDWPAFTINYIAIQEVAPPKIKYRLQLQVGPCRIINYEFKYKIGPLTE